MNKEDLNQYYFCLEFCWCDFERNLIQFLRDYFVLSGQREHFVETAAAVVTVSWFERSKVFESREQQGYFTF